QSDDGGDRRLPLVVARLDAALHAGHHRGDGLVDRAARRRPLLLQSDRADFRGRDVMNEAVIGQGIGKTYRLGEQGTAYTLLRERLVETIKAPFRKREV